MVKTTKGGKVMNPTDAYRKELRKKELKRNKKERKKVREVGLLKKDPDQIKDQIQKLEMMKAEGALDKARKHKKRQLEDTLNLVMKKRKEYEEKMKEKGEDPVMFSHLGPVQRRTSAEEEERAKHPQPEDSVYYHPTLNPTGAPPPGKPPMYKSSIGPRIPLSEASSSNGAASSVDLDGVELPAPPPPPPLPNMGDPDDTDIPSSLPPPPPPPMPPNERDGTTSKDSQGSNILLPPPPPPPGIPPKFAGNQSGVEPDAVNQEVGNDLPKMVPPPPSRQPPLSGMPGGPGPAALPALQPDVLPPGISRFPPPPPPDTRPPLSASGFPGQPVPPGIAPLMPRPPFGPPPGPPPMMRPPLPPGPPPMMLQDDSTAMRPTVPQKPSYVKSAAPTVVKRPLAQHTPELTAMVPASVRVRRESALPKPKPKAMINAPISQQPMTSAPKPESVTTTSAPKAPSIDDSYNAFLEDMKALGALDS
uniref:Wbp11/ELF5/Saf1 N-terminal domain-containing protein n=1 Tax=Chenopodium quinoa TaxID=63459 RepID=A0A803ME06_CHEQI